MAALFPEIVTFELAAEIVSRVESSLDFFMVILPAPARTFSSNVITRSAFARTPEALLTGENTVITGSELSIVNALKIKGELSLSAASVTVIPQSSYDPFDRPFNEIVLFPEEASVVVAAQLPL